VAFVDMMGYLIVFGLLLYVFFTKGQYLFDSARIFVFKWQVSDVSNAVVEFSQGQTTAGVTMEKIKEITPSYIGDGSDAVIFGGSFSVTNGTDPYEYIITADAIPTGPGHRIAAGWDQATYDASAKTVSVTYAP
jgi:hypothetical protein